MTFCPSSSSSFSLVLSPRMTIVMLRMMMMRKMWMTMTAVALISDHLASPEEDPLCLKTESVPGKTMLAGLDLA